MVELEEGVEERFGRGAGFEGSWIWIRSGKECREKGEGGCGGNAVLNEQGRPRVVVA